MQAPPKPSDPVSLLDKLSPEDRAKVAAGAAKRQAFTASTATDADWFTLSELGFYFGWGAIRDVLDDFVTFDQAKELLAGAKKVYGQRVYDSAIAATAARTTELATFNKLMKPYIGGSR